MPELTKLKQVDLNQPYELPLRFEEKITPSLFSNPCFKYQPKASSQEALKSERYILFPDRKKTYQNWWAEYGTDNAGWIIEDEHGFYFVNKNECRFFEKLSACEKYLHNNNGNYLVEKGLELHCVVKDKSRDMVTTHSSYGALIHQQLYPDRSFTQKIVLTKDENTYVLCLCKDEKQAVQFRYPSKEKALEVLQDLSLKTSVIYQIDDHTSKQTRWIGDGKTWEDFNTVFEQLTSNSHFQPLLKEVMQTVFPSIENPNEKICYDRGLRCVIKQVKENDTLSFTCLPIPKGSIESPFRKIETETTEVIDEENILETPSDSDDVNDSSWQDTVFSILKMGTKIGGVFFVLLTQFRTANAESQKNPFEKFQNCLSKIPLEHPDLPGWRTYGTRAGEFLGTTSILDFNGDGYADFLVGSRYEPPEFFGPSYLTLGTENAGTQPLSDLTNLKGDNGFRIPLSNMVEYGPASVGDFNDDGFDDFTVGHTKDSTFSYPKGGCVILGGKEPVSRELNIKERADGRRGFCFTGIQTLSRSGETIIRSAGRVQGTRFPAIIIGIPNGSCEAYLYFGKKGPYLREENVGNFNGEAGIKIWGGSFCGNYKLGHSVGSAGDFNEDGIEDFFLTLIPDRENVVNHPGKIIVIFGRKDWRNFVSGFDLNTINGQNGVIFTGDNVPNTGWSVSRAGNMKKNRNSGSSLIIGAFGAHNDRDHRPGECYLIHSKKNFPRGEIPIASLMNGEDGTRFRTGSSEYDLFGYSVSSLQIPQYNVSLVIMGAPGINRVYVVPNQVAFEPITYLNRLNGSNGFEVAPAQGTNLGRSVTGGLINGKPMIMMGAPYSPGRYGEENAGRTNAIFDCKLDPNSEIISSVDTVSLNATTGVLAVAKQNQQTYSATGQLFTIESNGTVTPKKIFFNVTTPMERRNSPYYPRLVRLNNTHFGWQDSFDERDGSQIQVFITTNTGNIVSKPETIFETKEKFLGHGVWPDNEKENSFISTSVSDNPTIRNRITDLSCGFGCHEVLLANPPYLATNPQLYFSGIDSSRDWVFYKSRAEIKGQLTPPLPRGKNSFTISDVNVVPSSKFFILPGKKDSREFKYLAFLDETEGPFRMNSFSFQDGKLPPPVSAKLLDITPDQETNVIFFKDYSFMVVYVDHKNNHQVTLQQFSAPGKKLGDSIQLQIFQRNAREKLFSAPLDNFNIVIGLQSPDQTLNTSSVQAMPRDTLFVSSIPHETVTVGETKKYSFGQNFDSTLSGSEWDQKISCQFESMNATWPSELQKNETLCHFEGKLNTIGDHFFNITGNNGVMTRHNLFRLNVRQAPSIPTDFTALWISLALMSSCLVGCFVINASWIILLYRYRQSQKSFLRGNESELIPLLLKKESDGEIDPDNYLITIYDRKSKELGTGNYAKVIQAMFENRQVAVKESLEKQKDALKSEFKIMLELSVDGGHNNIVKTFGAERSGDNNYDIVMEYVAGGSLADYLKKNQGNLSWEQVYFLLHGLASGVKYIHEKNYVHLDLKTDNILIDVKNSYCPVPKIGDFGSCKKAGTQIIDNAVGTPKYMHPDLLENLETAYHFCHDIHALMIIFVVIIEAAKEKYKEPWLDVTTRNDLIEPKKQPLQPKECSGHLTILIKNGWFGKMSAAEIVKDLEKNKKHICNYDPNFLKKFNNRKNEKNIQEKQQNIFESN